MSITTGVDIIEVSRIKEMLADHKDTFINKIYTKNEIEYCEKANIHSEERYAVRFAAKEAVYKALNVKDNNEINWRSIEVLKEENGRPYIKLYDGLDKFNNQIQTIDVSLSHIEQMAIANVVIMWKE